MFFWIDVSPNVKKFYMNLKMKKLPQFCIIILIIFGVVLNWCVTCLCIFHFETIIIAIVIVSFKMNQDLIAWRDMAGRNWITTIKAHHGWCTWSTIINGQGIIPEKKYMFVFLIWQFQRSRAYQQLESYSTSKDRKLISTVCPICTWISQLKSRLLS